MSHNTLRSEPTCLNCGAQVPERYCPVCGQENIELHDSAFHLLAHYLQDLIHYDGKTWHTLRNLVRKPGLTAVEYLAGKRKKNIEPIRFYVFSSTVFFILLFYVVKPGQQTHVRNPVADLNKRMYYLKKEKEARQGSADTLPLNALISSLKFSMDSVRRETGDSTERGLKLDLGDGVSSVPDSAGWFEKIFTKRTEERRIELEEKYQGDMNAAFLDLFSEIFHKLPQLIFLSLPFYAFLLKLLYFRHKRRLFVEHLIFSIYQYAYLYMVLMVFILLSFVSDKIGSDLIETGFNYLSAVGFIYLFVYPVLAMKRFYIDRWRYVLPRYFILMTSMIVVILILFFGIGLVTYLL